MKLVKQIHELVQVDALEDDQFFVSMMTFNDERLWNRNRWSDISEYLIENAIDYMVRVD